MRRAQPASMFYFHLSPVNPSVTCLNYLFIMFILLTAMIISDGWLKSIQGGAKIFLKTLTWESVAFHTRLYDDVRKVPWEGTVNRSLFTGTWQKKIVRWLKTETVSHVTMAVDSINEDWKRIKLLHEVGVVVAYVVYDCGCFQNLFWQAELTDFRVWLIGSLSFSDWIVANVVSADVLRHSTRFWWKTVIIIHNSSTFSLSFGD